MKKQELLNKIIELLNLEAENLINAAKTAHEDSIGEENKAENKYDTRSLEASYLAEAQANMASTINENIACYKNIELKDFNEESKVALTALIELESESGEHNFYFLGPKNGGIEIEYKKHKILLITPSSPIGRKLIGRQVGDCIIMNKKELEIVSLF